MFLEPCRIIKVNYEDKENDQLFNPCKGITFLEINVLLFFDIGKYLVADPIS